MENLTSPQRPIEFRTWHIPTQRMCYGALIDPFNNQKVIYVNKKGSASHIGKDESGEYATIHFDSLNRNDCVLMQYSGVLDKKGKKIWEGDILFWSFSDEEEGLRFDRYEPVCFQDGTFGVEGDSTEPIVALCRASALAKTGRHYRAIAGNIYQHRHLLALNGEFPLIKTSRQLSTSLTVAV